MHWPDPLLLRNFSNTVIVIQICPYTRSRGRTLSEREAAVFFTSTSPQLADQDSDQTGLPRFLILPEQYAQSPSSGHRKVADRYVLMHVHGARALIGWYEFAVTSSAGEPLLVLEASPAFSEDLISDRGVEDEGRCLLQLMLHKVVWCQLIRRSIPKLQTEEVIQSKNGPTGGSGLSEMPNRCKCGSYSISRELDMSSSQNRVVQRVAVLLECLPSIARWRFGVTCFRLQSAFCAALSTVLRLICQETDIMLAELKSDMSDVV
uniref:UDENN domain-containing protein n=1 Tax=Steinernema glaseri TaxID=37863 RepID=A0A1I8A3Q2_9BILA